MLMTDEVDQLREQYPTWEFGSVWATANSGPDNRRLTARQGTILLTAWDVGELREKLEHEHKTAPPA